jgi:hypothetical protein
MRDRKTSETMEFGDEYTVLVAVPHLEADAMARLLRQRPANLRTTYPTVTKDSKKIPSTTKVLLTQKIYRGWVGSSD